MRKFIFYSILYLLSALTISCHDDSNGGSSNNNGVAATGEVTELWATSATIGGKANLDANGTGNIIDYGVEYSTNESFQSIIRVSAKGQPGESFSVRLSKLDPETNYYYRTYVSTGSSQGYQGKTKSFTTKSVAVAEATEVGSMTAIIDGIVNLDENTSATIKLEYSTQSSFENKTGVDIKNLSGRTFSVELSALQPETKYYYRTSVRFMVNSSYKTYLGETKTFTTNRLLETDMYVDLGLPSGTLWATMNIGANSPTEYGDEFAWGETAPKNTYSWNTYKWCNGSNYSMTKYCTESRYGTVDNKTELDPEDDAAYVNWGSKWRIPSYDQIYELKNNCTSESVWLNAVHGILLKSKKNGATIFLPGNHYWSRNLYSSSSYAYYFYTNSDVVGVSAWGNRYEGNHIRAVQVSQN